MGTMASALAHELNQPLAAATSYIRAGVRMLPPELADSEAASVLSAANAQLLRAGEIIRRLRQSLSKGEAARDWVPVDALFDDSLHLVALAGYAAGVDVGVDVDPAAALIYADRIQIEQVLLNLIRNACEAMETAAPRTLRLRALPAPAGGVEIRVEDSGAGFSPESLKSLFSAFNSTTGGMGVGLSICRTIVESHGGKLRVENNDSGGATIAFTLPAPVPEPAETVVENG
jgi:two-component system sensor kinase FixL